MEHPHRGWYSRGYLPHLDADGVTQSITIRLADSLPKERINALLAEIEQLPPAQRDAKRRTRLEDLLDSGLGSCILRETEHAKVVHGSLLFGDGSRYRLLAWVVMPNHVHVLLEQKAGWPLSKVIQSLKRHTSRQIHLLTPSKTSANGDSEPLWERDYWDRYIRDQRHFENAKAYIEENPLKAGLVSVATDWPWGSAGFERFLDGSGKLVDV